MPARNDGRQPNQLRPVSFEVDFAPYPEGSVLISTGNTRVLCNVSVEDGVPPWMAAQNVQGGWVTGEYSMLPRSTHTRSNRETGRPRGRSQEIQRLIGRALRASVNLELLGPRTCTVDCDVIVADGGTRTTSITGGYVALAIALRRLITKGALPESVLAAPVAAVSAGIVNGDPLLDLCYAEDSTAAVDANFVLNDRSELIEIQSTAERNTFSRDAFIDLLDLATAGVHELMEQQQGVIQSAS